MQLLAAAGGASGEIHIGLGLTKQVTWGHRTSKLRRRATWQVRFAVVLVPNSNVSEEMLYISKPLA